MRILIADDFPNVQVGLRVLLEHQPGFEVVGVVASADELLTRLKATCPEVLLLGWELPGLAGADLLPALRKTCPSTLVVVLSGRSEVRREALAAGADAFASKVAPPEELLKTIMTAYQRGIEERNVTGDFHSKSQNSNHVHRKEFNKMQKHVSTVGSISLGLGTVGIILAAIFLATTASLALLIDGGRCACSSHCHSHQECWLEVLPDRARNFLVRIDPETLFISTIAIGGVLTLSVFLGGVHGVIGGIGLMKRKPWARNLVSVLAVLGLILVPFGTFAGGYALWTLAQDETVDFLTS